MTQPNNPPDIDAIVEGLDKIDPGFLRFDLFLQMARLSTTACIEVVPIREAKNSDAPEVLLLQRDLSGDPWEGEWHTPGTIIRPTDTPTQRSQYEKPFARLLGHGGEIAGATALSDPVEIGTDFRITRRGAELAVVHYVPVIGEAQVGKFISMNGFPDNVPEKGVIDHHVPMIKRAVKAYLDDKRS